MDLAAPALVTKGLVFTRDRVAPLAEDTRWNGCFPAENGPPSRRRKKTGTSCSRRCSVRPASAAGGARRAALRGGDVPAAALPADPRRRSRDAERGGCGRNCRSITTAGWCRRRNEARGFYEAGERRFLRRDAARKRPPRAAQGAGTQVPNGSLPQPAWELAPTKLPRVVRTLVEAGWHIEAEGKVFRRPGAFRIEVSTGIDWFELHGDVDYGETSAQLPELLEALRRGENMVRLDDGTFGVLPEEWLRRIGLLAGLGTPESGHSASAAARRACWMPCWPPSPRPAATRPSPGCARSCAAFRASRPPRSPPASWASCATTSAKAWAGWSSCAASASAAAWPTTWASARPRRCWRCWRRAAQRGPRPASRRHRWWWCRVAGLQLEAGGGALHAAAARARPHRPGARRQRFRRLRPGADHLRHRCAGHPAA